jgi:hypothetical protein
MPNSTILPGPAADAEPSEERAPHVRVGGSPVPQSTPQHDFQLHLTGPVPSPDTPDFLTQSWGTLSLGYNLATGEPRPGW